MQIPECFKGAGPAERRLLALGAVIIAPFVVSFMILRGAARVAYVLATAKVPRF